MTTPQNQKNEHNTQRLWNFDLKTDSNTHMCNPQHFDSKEKTVNTHNESTLIKHLETQNTKKMIKKKVNMYWMHACGTGAGYLALGLYHMANYMA